MHLGPHPGGLKPRADRRCRLPPHVPPNRLHKRLGGLVVGPIKSGLPSFGLPDVRASDVGALAAGGIGVMLVGFAEALGAAKAYAARKHEQIDPNRELLGLGAESGAPRVKLTHPSG